MTFRTTCRTLRLIVFHALVGWLGAAPIAFDIPAQPAPAAISAFIKQSGTRVAYVEADLNSVQAHGVVGRYEPSAALSLLLKDTGCVIAERKTGWFSVARGEMARVGSVEGSVQDGAGRPVAGAKVVLVGSHIAVSTDRRGRFALPEVPAGEHVIEVSAEGMLDTKITDVSVRGGHRLSLSTITVPAKPVGVTQLEPYIVSAKKNDGVVELDPYEVEGRREKPFVSGNLDITRTINDAQPYYIFDAKSLENSGAVNVTDFLKQRLPMNTVAQTNAQVTNTPTTNLGATSSINLRGAGTDKTLVLVNGRRMAGVSNAGLVASNTTEYQSDLNGIPLSAIDRIEVLPTSASGIYGGGAIGGVVNVILKKNYQGGEVRATYDNIVGEDVPRRTISFSYGQSLEDGRTQFSVNASWSDAKPLLFAHRVDDFRRYLDIVRTNAPTYISSNTNPWMGSLPNIGATSSSLTSLTFDDGTSLGAVITHVPAGLSPNAAFAEVKAALLANAGRYNLDFPDTAQTPVGLQRRLELPADTRSVQLNLSRQILPRLELLTSFSHYENRTTSESPSAGQLTIPGSHPKNPFTQNVRIKIPSTATDLSETSSTSKSFNLGLVARLPHEWISTFDYTWSESRFDYVIPTQDGTLLNNDINSGALNPFADPYLYPINWKKYFGTYVSKGSNEAHEVALRGSGSLPSLPWGQPTLTAGANHRLAKSPERISPTDSPSGQSLRTYYARETEATAGYSELTMPLVKSGVFPLVYQLELQASGRAEKFKTDTGTPSFNTTPGTTTITYAAPTLGGQPIFSQASYSSTNYTIGLRYQPIREITMRASVASAFVPPTPTELLKDSEPSLFPTTITDPRNGLPVSVSTIGGGNPDLKPQSSESLNVGVIWEPQAALLRGLRLNAEYYRIEQNEAISSLSAQQMVDMESTFPDRVTRNSSGIITLVDISRVNLYKLETTGWDLSASYRRTTSWGNVGIYAVHSIIRSLKTQYSPTRPSYDAAGFHPTEGGATKHKGNISLNWEHKAWSAGWTTRYFSAYKQNGAAGGPASLRSTTAPGAPISTWLTRQGGDTIASQLYHDAFIGYSMGKRGPAEQGATRMTQRILAGMSLQLGVRNVFDKVPPLDASYLDGLFLSPYGDNRPRSYWVSIKKAF